MGRGGGVRAVRANPDLRQPRGNTAPNACPGGSQTGKKYKDHQQRNHPPQSGPHSPAIPSLLGFRLMAKVYPRIRKCSAISLKLKTFFVVVFWLRGVRR